MESGISECSALQPWQGTMPGVTGHESNRLEKHLTYNMYMESTFCSFTGAGQHGQPREGLQFQWLKSELPEMKNPKHPSPHMIPIPCWGYQHVWFAYSAFQHTLNILQNSAFHGTRARGSLSHRNSSCRASTAEADGSESPWETAQHGVGCPELAPTASTAPPPLSAQGAEKVPARAKFQTGLEQQCWPLRVSPALLCHPSPEQHGAVPSSCPTSGHLTCTPGKRCLKLQALTTPRSWKKMLVCSPWAPEFRSSWHNARIILFYLKSGTLNSVLEEFAS